MEKILNRFLRYVSVNTQSDEESQSQPSAAREWDLLKMLRDELNALGVEVSLDEYGYVMASIPSNLDHEVPAVGFIAHVDTAPDASGKDVKPQIIEQYDGGAIDLKGVPGLQLKPEEFPGEIVTDPDGLKDALIRTYKDYDYEKQADYIQGYLGACDGHATERVINYIESMEKRES